MGLIDNLFGKGSNNDEETDFKGKEFYEIIETNVIIRKDGNEVGRGFLRVTYYRNFWQEEYNSHQREAEDWFWVLNGEELDEDDQFNYDETSWGEMRHIVWPTLDEDEVERQFKELKKDLIKD